MTSRDIIIEILNNDDKEQARLNLKKIGLKVDDDFSVNDKIEDWHYTDHGLGASLIADHQITEGFPTLRPKKKIKPLPDHMVSKCGACHTYFSMFIRKHHCRCCGEIFCYQCCSNYQIVPKNLLQYSNYKDWWTPGQAMRVCGSCSQQIQTKKNNYVYSEKLDKWVLPTSSLFRLSLFNTEWRLMVTNYLSDLRDASYLAPDVSLPPRIAKWIEANIDDLCGHSHWILQVLKLPQMNVSIINKLMNGIKRIDCRRMLCCRICRDTLNLGDLIVILRGRYNPVVKRHVENMILEYGPSELKKVLLAIFPFVSKYFHEKLIAKASSNMALAYYYYWLLCTGSTSNHMLSALRDKLTNSIDVVDLINFRLLLYNFDTDNIDKIDTLNYIGSSDIFNNGLQVRVIDSITVLESASRPLLVKYKTQDGAFRSFLYKRQDVRPDAIVCNLVSYLHYYLSQEHYNFPIKTYQVIPISSHCGVVEVVEDSFTLSDVLRQGSIASFLLRSNPDKTADQLIETYSNSLAFWLMLTYILGVGDRHLDNILLHKSGTLFHIDYEFLFGNDPKSYAPSIRLDSRMIDGIGGISAYDGFKRKCHNVFLLLRRYHHIIYSLIPLHEQSKYHLETVLLLGYPEEDVKTYLENTIDNSKDSIGGYLIDFAHYMASLVH